MKRGWLLAVLALALLLAGLQAKLWWGEGGWREAQALRRTVGEQKAENARLQQRNDALAADVEDLKSGETAVEERARSELGMVKPGETFYRVVEPHADPGAAPQDEGVLSSDEGRDVPPATEPPLLTPPAALPTQPVTPAVQDTPATAPETPPTQPASPQAPPAQPAPEQRQ